MEFGKFLTWIFVIPHLVHTADMADQDAVKVDLLETLFHLKNLTAKYIEVSRLVTV